MRVRKHKFFALSWGVAITLVVGLGASILGGWILQRMNEQQAQEAIAAATEEQSAVAEEISRNITTIAGLADQTSIQAHQSTDLSKELTNTAATQYALVARFNR